MDENPEAIRREIDQTQNRMSDTVEAIAYKSDVPARAKDAVADRVDAIKGSVSDAVSSARTTATNAGDNAREGLRTLQTMATSNPLGIAIGSLAVGFLVGLCLPVSDLERERVGPLGEQMTDAAKSAAADAVEKGKAAVTQAVGDAISGTTR